MNVTNRGPSTRALPNKGKYVEITPGATVDIDDKLWADLKKRPAIAADLASGILAEHKPEKHKAKEEPKA